jgi:hypothetical protein
VRIPELERHARTNPIVSTDSAHWTEGLAQLGNEQIVTPTTPS